MGVPPTLCLNTLQERNTAMTNSIYFQYVSKYERWYYSIINKAQGQLRSKTEDVYYESHHIIPKSLGGVDSEENLVLLTYREHLLCHWLLYKFNESENKAKMAHAFWSMCQLVNDNHRRVPPLHTLESARQAHIKALSEKMSGENNPMFGRAGFGGKKHSKEHIEKITGSGNPMFGRTHNEEARKRISESSKRLKDKPKSNTMRSKLSNTATGRKRRYLDDGSWTWEYPHLDVKIDHRK